MCDYPAQALLISGLERGRERERDVWLILYGKENKVLKYRFKG